jgi:hypothetical protein
MFQVQTISESGRKGAVLSKKRYDAIRDFILKAFESRSQLSFEYLINLAEESGLLHSDGISMWHLLQVKKDLQARRVIRVKFIHGTPKLQMMHLNKNMLKEYLALGR